MGTSEVTRQWGRRVRGCQGRGRELSVESQTWACSGLRFRHQSLTPMQRASWGGKRLLTCQDPRRGPTVLLSYLWLAT